MYKHGTTMRVRYAETDQMGVVYHANYLIYMEVARVEALRALGFPYSALEKQGIAFPVVNVEIKYMRPAFYDEELTVFAAFSKMSAVKIEIDNEVFNAIGELLCTAKVILVSIDMNTKKTCPIPENIVQALQKKIKEV